MIKIGTSKDLEKIANNLPSLIVNKCTEIVNVLDSEYGASRNIDTDMGGFVAIVDGLEDTEILNKIYNLDISNDIAEDIEEIKANDKTFLSILYLLSSDYAINVVAEKHLLPIELLKKFKI